MGYKTPQPTGNAKDQIVQFSGFGCTLTDGEGEDAFLACATSEGACIGKCNPLASFYLAKVKTTSWMQIYVSDDLGDYRNAYWEQFEFPAVLGLTCKAV